MIKKYKLGQNGFPRAGCFGGLVEQDMIIDDNANVAHKYQVGQRGKEHSFILSRSLK
jgi:hypothetical protein